MSCPWAFALALLYFQTRTVVTSSQWHWQLQRQTYPLSVELWKELLKSLLTVSPASGPVSRFHDIPNVATSSPYIASSQGKKFVYIYVYIYVTIHHAVKRGTTGCSDGGGGGTRHVCSGWEAYQARMQSGADPVGWIQRCVCWGGTKAVSVPSWHFNFSVVIFFNSITSITTKRAKNSFLSCVLSVYDPHRPPASGGRAFILTYVTHVT